MIYHYNKQNINNRDKKGNFKYGEKFILFISLTIPAKEDTNSEIILTSSFTTPIEF